MGLLFDLCGGGSEYDHDNNQETASIDNSSKEQELRSILNCHLDKTDPGDDPDYTTDCSGCADDASYLRNGNSNRSCANWAVNNPGSCTMDAGNQHEGTVADWCKVTCENC